MTEEGEEVVDKKRIARKYILHGTFIVDVLSILPLNSLIPVKIMIINFLGRFQIFGCYWYAETCKNFKAWKNYIKT